jgi:hypothetical protein
MVTTIIENAMAIGLQESVAPDGTKLRALIVTSDPSTRYVIQMTADQAAQVGKGLAGQKIIEVAQPGQVIGG